MFRKGEVKKTYWAIVKNKPKKSEARLEHYLVRNSEQNKSYAYPKAQPDSQRAVLSYKVVGSTDNYYLLEINLETGRHHQIRAQLAAIGCPIKGDLKYGAARSNPDGGISLHARQLEFEHPMTKELITITAPPPKNDALWEVFNKIKF